MLKKLLIIFILFSFFISNAYAVTQEASILGATEAAKPKFWQEFDIIFWQTAPYAVFWTGFADIQISNALLIAGAPHWETVLAVSALISAGNAYFYARKDMRVNKIN
ncbi:MAG: hypothetical protein QME05_01900 [Candidatus Margulisbacteria bacterium]|nr:hypothetical protein [Candidatus Margulisiibacteriota bacterium]